jgi:RNA polymerase sigma-70 factor (ECF subfamily)
VARDELDFNQFYAAHFASLGVQLYAYFGDRAEAQDIAQEAFCRAWQRWAKVSEYEDPLGWVRRVAWRLAISRWRRTKTALNFVRKQRLEDVPELSSDRVALAQALATLPPNQRRAVVLHYLSGLQVAEIAEQEGVAVGTVKSWLHRGRAALSAQLSDAPDAENPQEVANV